MHLNISKTLHLCIQTEAFVLWGIVRFHIGIYCSLTLFYLMWLNKHKLWHSQTCFTFRVMFSQSILYVHLRTWHAVTIAWALDSHWWHHRVPVVRQPLLSRQRHSPSLHPISLGNADAAPVLPHLVVMRDGCVTELPFEIQLEGEVQVTLKEIQFFLSSYFFEIINIITIINHWFSTRRAITTRGRTSKMAWNDFKWDKES